MPSPIDEIFRQIFGYLPTKRGAAFERLAAIALHLLEEEGVVQHDARLRGSFSDTLYQIDVHHVTPKGATMGEAKDYTEQNEKVGRGDLQKLAGALPDLDSVHAGAFFSATGYTGPAKKYAQAAANLTGGKGIVLYELKPSTETDEEGFIKTIIINIHFVTPLRWKAKFQPHFTAKGCAALKALIPKGAERCQVQMLLEEFFDCGGNKISSIFELTSKGYGDIDQSTQKATGCFLLRDHFIRVSGIMVEISGIEYEMPFEYSTREIRITDDIEHRFVISDENGNPLRILPDKILQQFSFDEKGCLAGPKISKPKSAYMR